MTCPLCSRKSYRVLIDPTVNPYGYCPSHFKEFRKRMQGGRVPEGHWPNKTSSAGETLAHQTGAGAVGRRPVPVEVAPTRQHSPAEDINSPAFATSEIGNEWAPDRGEDL